jgi:outer membrane protein assembly factor BamB
MRILALLVLALRCHAAPEAAPADAWPMFRGGPRQHGVASSALAPPLKLLWRHKTGGEVKSTAAIAGGSVFVGSGDGRLHALAASDGAPRWTADAGGAVESSPLALGEVVVVGSAGGAVQAFDAKTGKPRWTYKTGGKVLGSPAPLGAGRVVIGSYDNAVHCVEAATGKPVWTYATDGYVNGAPAVDGDTIVVGGCDAKVHVLDAAGKARAPIEMGAYVAATVAVDGGRAWVGHYGNAFVCVDLAGAKVAWVYKPGNFPVFGSPALAADRVVFGARDRKVHCLDRATGKVLWTHATRGKVDASPVIAGDAVVAGSDDGVLRLLSLSDGKEIWSHDLGAAIAASPAVAGGRVVVGTVDGTIWAFGGTSR